MRIVSAPLNDLPLAGNRDFDVVLFGPSMTASQVSAGARIPGVLRSRKLAPAPRAWDLLAIALSVVAADLNVRRDTSPDGWTRQLSLHVAVREPEFWNSQASALRRLLQFLTTDIWTLSFFKCTELSSPGVPLVHPEQDSVVLLSGGLDSLIGAIDIVTEGGSPYAVSQIAQGDKGIQQRFAAKIGGGLSHLQLNHNTGQMDPAERSQRARSILFLAFGVLAATALGRYKEGAEVPLFVCENGFISLNPPLTGSRIGSLSTRTTHPAFLRSFQDVLRAAEIRVRIHTPYQFSTKGEMLRGCSDGALLNETASLSTSCSRYSRYGYKHCGRCFPCLVRRAAFHSSDIADSTQYVFSDLSIDNDSHARFDDVRSAAMAVAAASAQGSANWARRAVDYAVLDPPGPYLAVVNQGIQELGSFLSEVGVL